MELPGQHWTLRVNGPVLKSTEVHIRRAGRVAINLFSQPGDSGVLWLGDLCFSLTD